MAEVEAVDDAVAVEVGIAFGASVRAFSAIRVGLISLCALVLPGAIGCLHIGPGTIVDDRLAYNEALARTWKEQTLLNIVKLRYADTPFFVDIAQIVAGYSVGHTETAEGAINSNPMATNFAQLLSGSLTFQHAYIDRPTVSYSPLNNNAKYIQNLTLPLPPSAVLYLMQAGYAIDFILDLTVDSINGVRNRVASAGTVEPATPEFQRLTQILRRAQLSGHVGMRIEVDKDKKESLVMSIRDTEIDPEMEAELTEARRIMKIAPDQKDLRVVFGAVPAHPNEIAMMTRSAFRILGNLATFVEVPPEHLASGRAIDFGSIDESDHQRFAVHSGCKKPCCCYAAVCYRGCWFWIDDCDLESKRSMAYLMVLLALADTGVKEQVPFLTIQAN